MIQLKINSLVESVETLNIPRELINKIKMKKDYFNQLKKEHDAVVANGDYPTMFMGVPIEIDDEIENDYEVIIKDTY